jgi:hypothetical protein
LWEHIIRSGGDFQSDWTLHHAYATNDLCESGRQHAWDAKAASMDKEAVGSPQVEVKKVPGEQLMLTIKAKNGLDTTWSHNFQCLPDSFAPRGEKRP